MKFKRIGTFLILLIINSITVSAQKNNDYKADWDKVDGFDKKGLTQSAWQQVKKIFTSAIKDNNNSQQIKAAMYQMKYRNMVEEENKENNIFYLDTLIEKASAPAKNILQSMQAELFLNYRNNNRYKFYGRTELFEEKSNDISTWSIAKLNTTIAKQYKASLQNTNLLKSTPVDGFKDILTKGQNTALLRPTLYDFLAFRALDYFVSTENDVTSPAYKFILNDEKIFAPVHEFVDYNFTTRDTASLYYNAILLLQDILKFHIADKNQDALLDADLARLSFAYNNAVISNKEKLYENALLHFEKDYSNNPISTQATCSLANLYYAKGQKFNAATMPSTQFDIKKAAEFCQEAIDKFPASIGALNAQNLLQTIKKPILSLTTEKVNVPDEPFRMLVKYKNVKTLYVRIIKTSRDEIKQIEKGGYNKVWPAMANLKAIKSWSISLPDPLDYQNHSAEIKIDALPIGTYYILASYAPDFSINNNILARQLTYVSNISYINNNKDELYILNRNSGQPLARAAVQVWKRKYNYNNGGYDEVKLASYTSDKNGYIKLPKTKDDGYDNFLQVKYNNDELFTQDNYYNFSYTYDGTKISYDDNTFFFTDRSIYRPGQTVFFKGIVVSTNTYTRKSTILPNYKTKVILYDANHQKVGSMPLTTNEYGSFNGSFKLPENSLNGQFSIQDSVSQSETNFNMEEYKRPNFFVEIKKPAGSYRVNDSVKVTGNAKAYAGNNIDGAKVTYRVVRKIRYPIWFGYGYRRIFPPYQSEQMEITNGETTTDANGNFYIQFKAIPDENADKKNQPVFYYEVSADITDLNGETRSGNTSIAVSYQALQLNVLAADMMPTDSIKNIKISSNNINGLFEKATVTFMMQKLQSPNQIYRERYWDKPDQFVLTKAAYTSSFPYDAYSDEDDMSKWPVAKTIITTTDTTAENADFKIRSMQADAGWYKITVTTKDKYGEEVKAEKYVQLTGNKTANTEPIYVDINNTTALPGQRVDYSIATGFDNIWLITNLSKMDYSINTDYATLTQNANYHKQINITEEDRGGMSLDYAFVKHNRVYSGNKNISIPWSNKDLNISFETFRDKILPGSEEKWSVKISGEKKEKVAAEALVSMYDASLDQFKPHSWYNLQSLWPTLNAAVSWTKNTFALQNSIDVNYLKNNYVTVPVKSYDALLNNGWNEGYYYPRGIMYKENTMMAASVPLEEKIVSAVSSKSKELDKKDNNVPSALEGKVAGVAVTDTATFDSQETAAPQNSPIQIRKNFNETAFFFPNLKTDADGNISFSFTIPEALTQWKLMTLAHTRELQTGYAEKTVLTQKPLMVQPFAPRFLREGDMIEFSAKIVNLSDSEVTGATQLELLDAATLKPVDGWFKNIFPNQYVTIAAGQSTVVNFPITIPYNFNSALTYRIKVVSKDASFSDGEEAALPVLTNRTLVTESLPLNMRNTNSKNFTFSKLLSSGNSGSLTNHALTVEYSSNPAWYAVQALPYLMEYPYECAEQSFNRYYANSLASFVSNSTPALKAIFEKWATLDTAALMSNLQKNEELKSALLQETPWVLDAKNEAKQKKNIALLFDMVRLSKEKNKTIAKLKEMQSSNGGFTWFSGGPDNRYITQYIITGIGHLKKLNALSTDDYNQLKPIISKALPYLDQCIKNDYDFLVKHKIKLSQDNLSDYAIQYLYMRGFFTETPINNNIKTAYNYYREQAQKYWLSNSKYLQAMIALALHRSGDAKTALAIIKSLKENAIYKEEMGMYWKEFTNGGYYWYQAPIESQAMMIEAFSDIDKNNQTIDDLKTWLLKQKQTQNWQTTKATAEACYALLLNGSNWLAEEKDVTIKMGNTLIKSTDEKLEAGTGYFKKTFDGANVQPDMGNITVSIKPTANPTKTSTSWGAVYWQYFEDMDKITSAETPLKLVKKLFIEKNTDKGPALQLLKDGDEIQIGDKIKVRIELRADRDMEFIHMKDMRASCMEPVNVLSQYKWQGGLGYYESTKDASTNFFFDWLPKGTYVFEYPMFVTHAGNFSNGITTIQCMHAPEFTSHSEGVRVSVAEKK